MSSAEEETAEVVLTELSCEESFELPFEQEHIIKAQLKSIAASDFNFFIFIIIHLIL